VGSDIIDIELRKTQNPIKKQKATILAEIAIAKAKFNDNIQARATEYQSLGIDLFDSLHIACAEEAGADIMLSTDDNLIKRAKNIKDINVRIENPVKWFMEVTTNEYND
jgi:predicted nucleic acid-binding protein